MSNSNSSIPDTLRPFAFHGVHLNYSPGVKECGAECPFCGKDRFSINSTTSKWQCFPCQKDGNAQSFLPQFWEHCDQLTTDYKQLTADRGLLYPETFMRWGFARSVTTGQWLVPGYSVAGKLVQLYKYTKTDRGMRLLATPTFNHTLWGVDLYDKRKSTVYLCEGIWDACTLWELLGHGKWEDDNLVPTAQPEDSVLADANVLAVPGCKVFNSAWCNLFAGKVVNLLYDNDHPRKSKTGKKLRGSAIEGTERVVSILGHASKPPAEINYLRWGKDGHNSELPDGHDVRDYVTVQ